MDKTVPNNFRLAEWRISRKGLKVLANALKARGSCSYLNLRNCGLDCESMVPIGELLAFGTTTLEVLW